MLSIAYPRELRLESPEELRPVSVWLWRATSTPGSTATPTVTPTPTPVPTGTAPPTPTPTATPRPWVIAFSPHNEGVLFTDPEGIPVAPQLALTPGTESAAPAVLYIQRAPLATQVPSTKLNVSAYGPDAVPVLTQTLQLSVNLESRESATRRHRQDLLFGPTTPLLILAGSLATFAAGEWRRRSDQEREERKRRVLAEVELLTYLKSQPAELILKYWELRERTEGEPDWNDPGVIQRLDEVLGNALTLEDLLAAIEQWFGELEDEEAICCAQLALGRDMRNETAQAFLQALNHVRASRETTNPLPGERAEEIARALGRIKAICGDAARARADRLLGELAERQGWYSIEKDALLRELGERQGWAPERIDALGFSREPPHWLDLWPATSPEDPQTVTIWLRTVGLAFNPFGPEAAELDSRLRIYGMGTVFEHIRGKRPVLIFGKAGSGKTAAALLLAYYCEDPPTAPREPAAIPVYLTFPIAASPSADQYDPLRTVAYATAQVVACYLAYRPEDFLKLPESRKHSLARLLSLWAGSADDLADRLRQVGPQWGTSSRLRREATGLYQEVSHEEMTEQECLDLLAGARPAGFECVYLLADLPSAATGPRALAMARSLHPLLDLVVALAARGVYLKLFLPEGLRRYLDIPTACGVTSLTWSAGDLTEMLEARFRSAGGESLGALCVPPDPDIDSRLIEAAGGSPRRVIRAGNALLEEHVRQTGGKPQLKADWVVRFLQAWEEDGD